MDYYKQDSCIHGYQIYQNIWTAEVNEDFIRERELLNCSDRYTVAILKNDIIVGSRHGFHHCFC